MHVSFMAVSKFKMHIIPLHFAFLMSAANNNPFHLPDACPPKAFGLSCTKQHNKMAYY